MPNHPCPNADHRLKAHPVQIADILANAPDPDPEWAITHADQALAYLFIAPRPCEALERLIRL